MSPNSFYNSTLTVFVAEDDIDDQEFLQEAFIEIAPKTEIHSFTTGKKFLNNLEQSIKTPALIILDYNIPELNGAEILKFLRDSEEYKDTVKIVWSTSNSPTYENSCLSLGAHAYFVKPSNYSGFSELAKKMLSYL